MVLMVEEGNARQLSLLADVHGYSTAIPPSAEPHLSVLKTRRLADTLRHLQYRLADEQRSRTTSSKGSSIVKWLLERKNGFNKERIKWLKTS